MHALVFNGPWDMTIEERPVRRPGANDVLIEVLATGICGSDLHGYTGDTGRRHRGQVMGHETVGRVVDIGAHVPASLVDALVTVNPVMACGVCVSCLRGQEQICEKLQVLGVVPHIDAAFADFVTVPVQNVVRLPASMAAQHGALIEPLAVGYHAAMRGGVGPGDRVVVIGGGPIGQAAALAAIRLGSHRVLVSEPDIARRTALQRLSIAAVAPDELADRIPDVLEGPPTVVLDAVGTNSTLSDALRLSSRAARIVLVGMAAPSITTSSYALSVDERSLVGSFCYTAQEFIETTDWASDHGEELDLLTDFTSKLADGPDLFRALSDGSLHANKVMLLPAAGETLIGASR